MMKIRLNDKSCIRPITDALVDPTAKRYNPMGFYLNDRVLRATGRWARCYLKRASADVRPTQRGYAKQYFCPCCGRAMWCTLNDTKQPAITCRKCHSESVELFFGSPIAEKVSWAYTTLLSENYDRLVPGESTLPDKVWHEWIVHPEEFAEWLQHKVDIATRNSRFIGRPVWLVARGRQWDSHATVSRAMSPRGARVRVL